MASPIKAGRFKSRAPRRAEHGFSIIEVMISIAVLTVGLVSLLGVFGLAMAATQQSQENMIAKQLADEALESIITARNTTQISWSQIWNASSCPSSGDPSSGGIFMSGLQSIYQSGADGIYGTCDDTAAGLLTLADPGPDGIYNTSDDTTIALTNYQRSISIGNVLDANGNVVPTLRAVTITVQYSASTTSQTQSYVLNSYISEYP